jgi:hypothetical protein
MQIWLRGVIVILALAFGLARVSAQTRASANEYAVGRKCSGFCRGGSPSQEFAGRGVVVGSSSILLWNDLEIQFRAMPVILKRGFGGA